MNLSIFYFPNRLNNILFILKQMNYKKCLHLIGRFIEVSNISVENFNCLGGSIFISFLFYITIPFFKNFPQQKVP